MASRPLASARSRGTDEADAAGLSELQASPKRLSWLMVRNPKALPEKDRRLLSRLLQNPQAEAIYRLAQQFTRMVRERLPHRLNGWIAACLSSGAESLANFASSLRQDYQAVKAALEMAWSNGQAEGQINRLKLLKRQMYGRAGFDLLRRRVLHAA